MAVTKTHPIKSTLKAAIDYILNPEKTDGKLLASSFGCGLETADIEFAWTRETAGDRGTHLGRHLIQSFAVGETTPEEAHKIGMELAGAVLGGKYEFVLTTHVDKDHLHNHLIFNAVSFVDYKKYHSNKQSYHFIRRTSDRISSPSGKPPRPCGRWVSRQCRARRCCGGRYAPGFRLVQGRRLKYPPMPYATRGRCPCRSSRSGQLCASCICRLASGYARRFHQGHIPFGTLPPMRRARQGGAW